MLYEEEAMELKRSRKYLHSGPCMVTCTCASPSSKRRLSNPPTDIMYSWWHSR